MGSATATAASSAAAAKLLICIAAKKIRDELKLPRGEAGPRFE
jgi:hypothetical protein